MRMSTLCCGSLLLVITEAGIDAESGILHVLRGSDGLWQNHHAESFTTPQQALLRDLAATLKCYACGGESSARLNQTLGKSR